MVRVATAPRGIVAAVLLLAAFAAGTGCKRTPTLAPEVARLIEQLRSPDARRRRDAAIASEKTAPLPPEAIAALAQAVRTATPNDPIQFFASDALARAGSPAIPVLTELMSDESLQVRARAIETLGRIAAYDSAALPPLIDALKTDRNRLNAVRQLAEVGPSAVPLLVAALKDRDPRVRGAAAESLQRMAALALGFRGVPPGGRPAGVTTASPADLAPAAGALTDALSDPDPNVRAHAALALANVPPHDARAVPALVGMAEGGDSTLRTAALFALRAAGSTAKGAVPALQRILAGSPDAAARSQAAFALAAIDGTAACEPLGRAMSGDADANVRNEAMIAMTRVVPPCPQALPTLLAMLNQRRSWATGTLGKMREAAMPALVQALKSPDLYVRENAVAALALVRPLTPDAIRALEVALKDKSREVRSAAATALESAGGDAQKAALAEEAREGRASARASQPDMRHYSQTQIIAPIPADADHKYPLTLVYLYPLSQRFTVATSPQFLITLHAGQDRPERLVFWKKVGDDQYQRLKVIEGTEFGEEHFETPITFRAKVQRGPHYSETRFFVNVPIEFGRSRTDQVFAYGWDGLRPVELESPEEWYRDKLAAGETFAYPARNSFCDDRLTFEFWISSGGGSLASTNAGRVTGTYKITELSPPLGGAVAFNPRTGAVMSVPRQPIRAAPPRLKMVVDTASRVPPPTPGAPLKKPVPSKAD